MQTRSRSLVQAIYPATELFLISRYMDAQQVKPAQWLLGTGLEAEQMKEPDLLMSVHQFDVIYRNIYRLSASLDVGFEFGRELNLSRWGLLSLALQSAKTLGHALAIANRQRLLVRSRFSLIPRDVGRNLEIVVQPREGWTFPVNQQFSMEVLLSSLQRQISDLVGQPFHFEAVSLAYPETKNAARYPFYCNCPVTFGCEKHVLLVQKSILEKALPMANKMLERQVLLACERDRKRVENAQTSDIEWQVKSALMQKNSVCVRLDDIANRLGISSRTLRRRLQKQNSHYSRIVQQVQREKALEGISNFSISLSALAEQCGFSNASSFGLAFRKWTGESPGKYRRQLESV